MNIKPDDILRDHDKNKTRWVAFNLLLCPFKTWSEWEKRICAHCGHPIGMRNPSGYCDHLYYPSHCLVCKETPHSKRYRNVHIEDLLDDRLFDMDE